ncbi:hypothetical protein [Helicobacter rodentium]|nr:hypothetical protein [Helicobacter rodentium]
MFCTIMDCFTSVRKDRGSDFAKGVCIMNLSKIFAGKAMKAQSA